MRRLLIDEQKKPVRVLERGERKAIHNQRTVLVLGDDSEVEAIREIFKVFVSRQRPPDAIATMLNSRQIPSPGPSAWTRSSVNAILRNEIYAGTMVWNKTSKKLNTRCIRNAPANWVRTEQAFEPIVPKPLFDQAQQIIHAAEEALLRRYSDADMLSKLMAQYRQYGTIRRRKAGLGVGHDHHRVRGREIPRGGKCAPDRSGLAFAGPPPGAGTCRTGIAQTPSCIAQTSTCASR